MGGRHMASRHRRGFTLVELIVALLIVDVALLALVGSGTTLSREVAIAALRARAEAGATARMERLASESCSGAAFGDSVWAPAVHEWWTVARPTGNTVEISDSLVYTTSGGASHFFVLRTRARC